MGQWFALGLFSFCSSASITISRASPESRKARTLRLGFIGLRMVQGFRGAISRATILTTQIN